MYERYIDMLARCSRLSHPRHADYGGRGIEVCPKWRADFWCYVDDLGPPPDDGHRWTVDRIDNDGNYEPGNVRWARYSTQNKNRRPTHLGRTRNPKGQFT